MRLTADLPATLVTAEASDEVTGVAVPYDTYGRTSGGLVAFAPGSLRVPDRVPLILDHDTTRPVGVVTAVTDLDDRAVFTARLDPTPPAELARAQMRSGSRAGVSVGVEVAESTDTPDGTLITSADLLELSSVVLPAYREAIMIEAAAPKTTPDPEPEDPAVPTPVMPTVAPAHPVGPPATPPPYTTSPPRTVAAFAEHVARLVRAGDAADARDVGRVMASLEQAALRAALTDIKLADTPPAPTYLSELDNYVEFGMPFVNAFTVQSVTRWPIKQRQIKTWPQAGKQTAEKTAIPSSPFQTEWANITDLTYAHGNDVSLQDIEDNGEQVLTDLMQAVSEVVANLINADALAAADDAALTGGTTIDLTTIGAALGVVLGAGRGAPVIVCAPDVWGKLWALTAGGGPALARLGGLDMSPPVIADAQIDAGVAYVGARSAFKTYMSAESRLRAIEVSLLGLNVGLYRRAAFRVVDADAIVKLGPAV